MAKTPLTKADLKKFKEQLLILRARLRGDVHNMADIALNANRSESSGDLSSMPIHMADIGSDNFEQEFTLGLIQTGSDTLDQIENALERIEEGTYGLCETCDDKIPKGRLNAIPYACMCVKCAEKAQTENNFMM